MQIFEDVQAGLCDLGVVPLENSLQGTVGVSFDLFSRFPVSILAELYAPISHCLLSSEEHFSDIKTVYSHPQPLAQCAMWLRTHLPQASLVPVESTASAARRIQDNPGTAAIGIGHLAEMLRLNVLARGIEDAKGNWTRFVIISRAGDQHRLGSLAQQKSRETEAQSPRCCSRWQTSPAPCLLFLISLPKTRSICASSNPGP